MGAVALALALIWVAPGVGQSDEDSALILTSGEEGEPAVDLVGRAAPGFTLKDMNGATVTLSSFKGKVVIVNFWATWCTPCRVEIPDLVELQKQYRDDLVILGVSIDDTPDKLRPYAEEMKINYPLLIGRGHDEVAEAYGGTWSIPVSVFIDRKGVVAKRHPGMARKDQLEREIKPLL